MKKKTLTPAQQRRQETRRINGEYDRYEHQPSRIRLNERTYFTLTEKKHIDERVERIRDGLYVPATTIRAAAPASSTANTDQWWDRAYKSAEYQPGTRDVPMLSKGNGNRMKYDLGAGELRLPSKTAITRYLNTHDTDIVDVPYGWTDNKGRSHQGWVRIGRNEGVYETQVLGRDIDPNTRLAIGESINATLEGRRAPFYTLGEMRAVRETRQSFYGRSAGQHLQSSFIDSVAWNEQAGTILVGIRRKDGTIKGYEYKSDKETYHRLINAESPGKVYNETLKREYREKGIGSVRYDKCDKCGRFIGRDASHVCPVWGIGSYQVDMARERARATAVGLGTRDTAAFRPDKYQHVNGESGQGWSLRTMSAGLGKFATGATPDKDGAVYQFAPYRTLRKVLERDLPPNERKAFARVNDTADSLDRAYGDDVTFSGAVYSPVSTGGERLSVTGGRLRDPRLAERLKAAEEAFRRGEPDRRIDVLLALNEKVDMEFGRVTRLESDGDYIRFDVIAES